MPSGENQSLNAAFDLPGLLPPDSQDGGANVRATCGQPTLIDALRAKGVAIQGDALDVECASPSNMTSAFQQALCALASAHVREMDQLRKEVEVFRAARETEHLLFSAKASGVARPATTETPQPPFDAAPGLRVSAFCASEPVQIETTETSVIGEDVAPQTTTLTPAIKVCMDSATNLRRADWNYRGSSDPYCVCEIRDKPWTKNQSHVVPQNLNPTWEHEYFIYDYDHGDSLNFSVFDWDWGRGSDFLGKAILPFDAFFPHGFDGDLVLSDSGKASTAKLRVKVEHISSVDKEEAAAEALAVWRSSPRTSCMLRSTRVDSKGGERSKGSQKVGEHYAQTFSTECDDDLPKAAGTAEVVHLWVLTPDSSIRLLWDILGICVLIIDLVSIPLQAFDIDGDMILICLGWVTLIYWSLDIAASFNTAYYTKDSKLVMSHRGIAINYIKGWLTLDVLLVAVDWVQIIQNEVSESASKETETAGAARAGKSARVLRIMRLLRLMRLAKLRQLLFTLQGLIDSEWLTVVFAVSKNLLTILALNHYLACAWFAIGDGCKSDGWVNGFNHQDDQVYKQYMAALHWTLSQFTPGKSPIRPSCDSERLFAIGVLVLGMVVATCFVSSITSTLSAVWTVHRNAHAQAFFLKKFLNQNNVSRELGARVTRYIENVMELRQKKLHASKVQYLSLLSGPLNIELQLEIWGPRLSAHPSFLLYSTICKPALSQICVQALSNLEFGKGDVVFQKGVQAKAMYFLSTGTLAYRYRKGTLKLVFGEWCTEAALWTDWSHAGHMKAVNYVDIILVNAQKFCDAASTYEDAYKFSHACALNFLSKFNRETATDIVDDFHVHKLSKMRLSEVRCDLELQRAEDCEIELMHFDDLDNNGGNEHGVTLHESQSPQSEPPRLFKKLQSFSSHLLLKPSKSS